MLIVFAQPPSFTLYAVADSQLLYIITSAASMAAALTRNLLLTGRTSVVRFATLCSCSWGSHEPLEALRAPFESKAWAAARNCDD